MNDTERNASAELESIDSVTGRPAIVMGTSLDRREDYELRNETNNVNEFSFHDNAISGNAYYLELPQNSVDQQELQSRLTTTPQTNNPILTQQNNECVLQAPKWIADHDAPVCMNCALPFHSFFRRRHHCRNCGGVFCNICSSLCTPLPKFGLYKAVRVCKDCFMSESKNSQ